MGRNAGARPAGGSTPRGRVCRLPLPEGPRRGCLRTQTWLAAARAGCGGWLPQAGAELPQGGARRGPVKRCCQGERRMDLGAGQQVADLLVGRILSVELPALGSAGEAGADVDASGGGCRRTLDVCLASELDQALGFTVPGGGSQACLHPPD